MTEMRTIQERLRNPPDSLTGSPCVDEATADEAADRIDALEKALKPFSDAAAEAMGHGSGYTNGVQKEARLVNDYGTVIFHFNPSDFTAARAALTPKVPT